MRQAATKHKIVKKILRVIAKTLIGLLLFLLLVTGLILLPPVQTFIVQKAAGYLENKIHTPVSIEKLYIGFPKTVVLEGIYLQDQSSDTLLYAGSIKVKVGLLSLIRGKSIDVDYIGLDRVTARVNRLLPDTSFNFQYIIDAFASKSATTAPKDSTGGMPIQLGTITLHKIRATYKDAVTGYDADLSLGSFDTELTNFDLDNMDFALKDLELADVKATLHQTQALETSAAATAQPSNSVIPTLETGKITLKNIDARYDNDVDKIKTAFTLGQLLLEPGELNLSDNIIRIRQFTLNNSTAAIELRKLKQPNKTRDTAAAAGPGWHVYVQQIRLNNNHLAFDDNNAPAQKKGMDYMHLNADSVTLHLNDFVFSNDSIAGKIPKAKLIEKSGFQLQQLQADFIYTAGGATLNNLYVKTPGTEITRSLSIQYPSLEAFQKNLNTATVQIDIENSRVQVKDILSFVPALQDMPAFAHPNESWLLTGKLSGRLNNLSIEKMDIAGLRQTKVQLKGMLKGLPDINKLSGNLAIQNISSSRTDLLQLIPAGSLPANIELPEKMQVSGTLNAASGTIKTSLRAVTSLGNVAVRGRMGHLSNTRLLKYDLTLQTTSLQLGKLLKDTAFYGPVSATLTAKGRGLDPKTMEATLSGKVLSAVLNHYTYKDLEVEGSVAKQQAAINAAIADPNIHFQLDAKADLGSTYPALQLALNIDSVKAKELHFTTDELTYRGVIQANFPSTDPDSLAGKLFILQSLLVHNQHRIQMDSLQLTAEASDTSRKMEISSDLMYAQLQGRYRLTEMGQVFQTSIRPFFSLSDSATIQPQPYDFTFDAYIPNAPQFRTLLPDLRRMDSISLKSRFTSAEGITFDLTAPAVYYGKNFVDGFVVKASTSDDKLSATASLNKAAITESIVFNKTEVSADIANNTIDLSLRLNDPADKQRYFLRSTIAQLAGNRYDVSVAPDSLMLNYKSWTADPNNKISFGPGQLHADHFNLGQEQQQLSIQSRSPKADAPVDIRFQNFKIATLSAFVQPDTTLANGTLNGQISLENILQQPVFTGDLTIDDLSLKKDTVGNLQIKVDNKIKDTYSAFVTLQGNDNDLQVQGNYFAANSSFDAQIAINRLPMKTVEAVSYGALSQASGNLTGNFTVRGTTREPQVNGNLNFDNAAFVLNTLNNYFKIDQEKITVTNEGLQFDKFQVRDSANNELTINGAANTQDFIHYDLDLRLTSNNFRALNSTRQNNQLFWGKLYFDSNLRIKGTESAPSVDGRLKINDKTDMTVVMPQNEPGVVDREGVVVFVDKDSPQNDSLFLQRYDSLNTSSLQGMNVSVNVEVDKKAKFKLIVDQGSGDALDIQGGAQLTAGVEPGGRISLAGIYEIEDGGYNLNYNLLRRKFIIESGSKITWEGEPTNATVAITAKYTATTSPMDLVKNQLSPSITVAERNTYLQKLPFQVLLKMEGALLQPKISFDIILPEGRAYNVSNTVISDINTKLTMLRQDDAEMNKQVFALLLLNRFVSEDPFRNSNSTSTTTLVMQSVSKFMSEQLNQWAQDLIKGVDINFDLQSTDDFSSGERESRTDLNVGLSKRLLNDRLTVSVGSNFELDGPKSSGQQQQGNNIAGNITVDYKLTEDGRYMLRGYRKNDYQGVIEGYIIETGIGFVITMDYNRFREIFQKRKDRKQIRAERRANRKNNTDKNEEE